MSKRLGISPKSVESRVSVQSDAHEMLWLAVPRQRGENLKAWFIRAGCELCWRPRRVRAYWNREVRRVDYIEIETLNQRIESAKAAEKRHQEHANEIRQSLEMGSSRRALDGRQAQRVRDEVEKAGGVVPRSSD